MAGAPASPRPAPRTVAQVMRPALTTMELDDHVAAAAYLMKHADATALVVVDAQAGQPVGIVTDTDVAHVVADGKDVNEVRVSDVMTRQPAVVEVSASLREAARLMISRRIRHLPAVSEAGVAGIVDIGTVCVALLDL